MKRFTTKRDKIKEGIIYDELAKTDDSHKFMLKVHPEFLLKGDKISEIGYLYALGRISGMVLDCAGEGLLDILAAELQVKEFQLIEAFNKAMDEGFYVLETRYIEEYDQQGKLIDDEDYLDRRRKKVVTKRIEQTTKTTYYLSDKKKFKVEIVKDYGVDTNPL